MSDTSKTTSEDEVDRIIERLSKGDADEDHADDDPRLSPGALVFLGIAVFALCGVVFFYLVSWTSTTPQSPPTTPFYTQRAANVRSCKSLSCDIVRQVPVGTEFDLPYRSVNDLPEWVSVIYTGVEGYLNTVNLGTGEASSPSPVEAQGTPQQSQATAQAPQTSPTQNVQAPSPPQEKSDADLFSEWKNRVAEVMCYWYAPDGSTTGEQGSATLVNVSGYGLTAVTNAHVESDANGGAPSYCFIGVYGVGGRDVTYDPNNNPFYHPNPGADVAYIKLGNPYYSTDNGAFDTNATTLNICPAGDAVQGDQILILGYPWNGSQGSLTITRGIIAGFDGDYYVTDAKIEHGNSGGAAILVKDDCWLGIPSAAVVGNVESYGRILAAKDVFGQ
jgi:hypothetical protein